MSNIENAPIEDFMARNYLQYAFSITLGRAIPALEDGLKPVHRRVLYGCSVENAHHNKPFRKNALLVGTILGRYHPHGDTSVYDTLIGLSRAWTMRMPLIQVQGNAGNISGDNSAAMRYTEGRLSKVSASFLDDLKFSQTVNWRNNYNNEEKEPELLPVHLPNILINGTTGIAVGYSSDIPPHNPKEVVNLVKEYIRSGETLTDDEIIDLLEAPDFPTGGIITNKSDLRNIYKTGNGVIRVKGKFEIVEDEKYIRVTELPYGLTTDRLISTITERVREKKDDLHNHLVDIKDYSDRRGKSSSTSVDIRIFANKKADLEYVSRLLLSLTPLQSTVKCNFNLVYKSDIGLMTLPMIVRNWVKFRYETAYRKINEQFSIHQNRLHIYEGMIKVIGTKGNLDKTISTIRSAPNKDKAAELLKEKIGLSLIQSNAILELTLSRLTKLGIDSITQKRKEIEILRNDCHELLTDKTKMAEYVIGEMEVALSSLPKDSLARLTQTEDSEANSDVIIEPGVSFITLSLENYVRRVDVESLTSQKRGGKGRTGIKVRKNDAILSTLTCDNESTLFALTNQGRVHSFIAGVLREDSLTSTGGYIGNYIALSEGEKVVKLVEVSKESMKQLKGYSVCLIANTGKFKKTSLSEYLTNRKTGVIAINLDEGSHIVDGCLGKTGSSVMLVTKMGYCVHFNLDSVRSISRTGKGQGGAVLREGDNLIACVNVSTAVQAVSTITEDGYAKSVTMDQLPIKSIYTKGYKIIPTGRQLNGVLATETEDMDCLATTLKGKAIRFSLSEIRETKARMTLGVKVVTLDKNDNVLNVCMFVKD